jgi:uncharacterized protein YjbJ (UPF0337 family)
LRAFGLFTVKALQSSSGWNAGAWTTFAFRGGFSRTARQGGGMDWDRIKGRWKQVSGQAKQQWGKLTDDDLVRVDGKRDQFEGLIQERYGKSKDDVRREVDDWLNRI